MEIHPPFGRKTDCHVGPMALIAMTDHGAAEAGCDEPVGRGILDAPPGVFALLVLLWGGGLPPLLVLRRTLNNSCRGGPM